MVSTAEIINSSCLVYVDQDKSGIYRKGSAGHFYYVDIAGQRITNEADLNRIKALVLPPAWKEVWISPSRNGYLQATGIDSLGRKQYRYHPEWVSRRSEKKYFNLLEFGKALPAARKKIVIDLKRRVFDERKVLALCVALLQQTLIRMGNESYKRKHGSYGLTTLKDRHLKEKDDKTFLCFTGKKGVRQEVELSDKTLIRLVKRCKNIPGQELFQFYTRDGRHSAIDSGMLNAYIREITGGDFTAKDFRTWGGTLEMFCQLTCFSMQYPEVSKKKIMVEALDQVALKLGNTRAVCKKSYVDPRLLQAFEKGTLQPYLHKAGCKQRVMTKGMYPEEKILLQFLCHFPTS